MQACLAQSHTGDRYRHVLDDVLFAAAARAHSGLSVRFDDGRAHDRNRSLRRTACFERE
jgi:hypothetical protein